MERAGVPTLSVVTVPFGFKVRAEVKALGMSDLPIQILPHPIGQISDQEMRDLTDEAYDEVLYALTTDACEVAKTYKASTTPRSTFSR